MAFFLSLKKTSLVNTEYFVCIWTPFLWNNCASCFSISFSTLCNLILFTIGSCPLCVSKVTAHCPLCVRKITAHCLNHHSFSRLCLLFITFQSFYSLVCSVYMNFFYFLHIYICSYSFKQYLLNTYHIRISGSSLHGWIK